MRQNKLKLNIISNFFRIKILGMRIGFIIILLIIGFIFCSFLFVGFGDSLSYIKIKKCDPISKRIIDKYNINKDEIHRCDSEKFTVEGKEIYVVEISYGPPCDCPAGCVYNYFTTIIEGESDFPYTLKIGCFSVVIDEDGTWIPENPPNILGLTLEEVANHESPKFTGRNHWFTKIPEFESLGIRIR